MKECTTHHYACDCRETAHKAEIAALQAERDTLAAKVAELTAQVNNYAELWTFLDASARFKASERHGEWKSSLASQSAQQAMESEPRQCNYDPEEVTRDL